MEESNVKSKISERPNEKIGYGLAALTALMVFTDLFVQLIHPIGQIGPSWSNLFRLALLIYYLIWTARLHKIVAAQTNNQYHISHAKAIGFHFIPFFNFYWIFKWPLEMLKHIESKGKSSTLKRTQIIGLLAGGIVFTFVPIPAGNVLIWIGSLFLIFIYLYILFSLFNDVLAIDTIREEPAEPVLKAAESVFDKDTFIGWALIAIPGIFLLKRLLPRLDILPFQLLGYVNVILLLIFWSMPLLIGFKLKNPLTKLLLITASSLTFLAILLMVISSKSENFIFF